MFVLDQIRRFGPTGAQTVVTQLPRGAPPAGVKLDASGTLYVAATGFDLATGQTAPDDPRCVSGWARWIR